MKKLDKEKQNIASLPIIILIVIILGIFILIKFSNEKRLTIMNQNTNEVYLSIRVKEFDSLSFHWIHSFEHIPWDEEYIILNNNKLLLKNIHIAGFGAGIPHNKGKTTVLDNGTIVMEDINEEFNEINWFHSQTAIDFIELNNNIIVNGVDLPHHETLRLKIEKRLKIWQK